MKRARLMSALVWALTLSVPSSAAADPDAPPVEAEAPAETEDRGFGVAVSSALNGEVLPFRLIATGLYYDGVHQFEFGVGLHPLFQNNHTVVSADFNYKLFPNGRENKLSTYLLANLSYIHSSRETFYPTSYDYLFLHGGYGIELDGLAGSYLDTNVSFGGFTYRKDTENPAASYLDSERLFEDFGFSIAFQLNVGYRF